MTHMRPSDVLLSLSPAARDLFRQCARGPVTVWRLQGSAFELLQLRLVESMAIDRGFSVTVSQLGKPVAEWIRAAVMA